MTVQPATPVSSSARPVTRPDNTVTEHHRVVVVGGGTGGVTVAAKLAKRIAPSEIAIVEPSDKHYYQPLWTLVGGGLCDKEITERPEASVIPPGTRWIRERVDELDPRNNRVRTDGGRTIGYDFLVLSPGMQVDWDAIQGLRESLGKRGVCCIYDYVQAERTWEMIRAHREGNAVFTMPSTPIKCPGAPQKIMYLAEEHFREAGVRDRVPVIGRFGTGAIFGVEPWKSALQKVVARCRIDFQPHHELVAIDPDRREATFEHRPPGGDPRRVTIEYGLLHAVPPMSAPAFIKRSPLATTEGPVPGWARVDKYSLQSPDFPNVFALGDASSLPTSRTGAAIRAEAPVVVDNLLAAMRGEPPVARYDGYAACPLVTSKRTVMLAEFDYDKNPKPTFPFDQSKERYSMYLLKRYGLPIFYWNRMLRGRG